MLSTPLLGWEAMCPAHPCASFAPQHRSNLTARTQESSLLLLIPLSWKPTDGSSGYRCCPLHPISTSLPLVWLTPPHHPLQKDGFSPDALQLPASPKARKLGKAGAELCLGLRGAHKTKTSVLEKWKQCWVGLEGYTGKDKKFVVDTEG